MKIETKKTKEELLEAIEKLIIEKDGTFTLNDLEHLNLEAKVNEQTLKLARIPELEAQVAALEASKKAAEDNATDFESRYKKLIDEASKGKEWEHAHNALSKRLEELTTILKQQEETIRLKEEREKTMSIENKLRTELAKVQIDTNCIDDAVVLLKGKFEIVGDHIISSEDKITPLELVVKDFAEKHPKWIADTVNVPTPPKGTKPTNSPPAPNEPNPLEGKSARELYQLYMQLKAAQS